MAVSGVKKVLSIAKLNQMMAAEKERLRREAEEKREKFLESHEFVTRRRKVFKRNTDIIELRYMNKIIGEIDRLSPKEYLLGRVEW
jgi:hypothetical protein